MATRAPTSWTTWLDQRKYANDRVVRTDATEAIVSDLHYLMRCERIGYTMHFPPMGVGSGSFREIRRLIGVLKDHLTATATDDRSFDTYVKAWLTGTTTDGRVRLSTVSAADIAEHTIISLTPKWTSAVALNHRASTAEDIVKLSARIANGTGDVWISGIAIFAPEGI